MEVGLIRRVDIDQEMQQSYLDYAMSVIVARALPDARDGLKPVQRRILYAMYDMNLAPGGAYKKSARIVGEVLGKYHPHGDVAVYEAMARLAQDFSMRYPMVDGQGNFGSVDGDPPAAMRYTEARLTAFSTDLMTEINRDTVDFGDNFDGTLREPLVLPALIPNLLVNGATGIAVGMATSIPPHNLTETVDALEFMLEQWDHLDEVAVPDLMRFIKGPDFPTGGIILHTSGENGLEAAYGSGRGRITVRGRVHAEDMGRGRMRLIITELPYQTNKTNLLERIAELVRDGVLDGISDLRDESDRQGMRIVIELKQGFEIEGTLRTLYKSTPLETTIGITLLALVENEPRLLNLKQALRVFLEHRLTVVRRRSEFDLAKAKARAHILEGLRVALDNLDAIIQLIRSAPDAEQARIRLVSRFHLSEIQAQAILDMQLRRLAALERKKIEEEYKEVSALIKELEALLKSPKRMREVVGGELKAVKEKYGDRRRTQLFSLEEGATATQFLTASDLAPTQAVWVGVTPDGRISRTHGESLGELSAGVAPRFLIKTNTRSTLYLYNPAGQAAAVAVSTLPEGETFADGVPLYKACAFAPEDRCAGLFAVSSDLSGSEDHFVLAFSRQGMVKKSALIELPGPSAQKFVLIKVNSGDELLGVFLTDGGGEIGLFSEQGMAIHFSEEDVRPMGLVAAGVMGIKLADGDGVATGLLWNPKNEFLLVASDGSALRVPASEFPLQGRYGQGVIAFRPPARAKVVDLLAGGKSATALMHFEKSEPRKVRLGGIPLSKRAGKGANLAPLKGADHVVAFTSLGEDQPPAPKSAAGPKKGSSDGQAEAEGKKPSARKTVDKKPVQESLDAGKPAAAKPGSSKSPEKTPAAGKKTDAGAASVQPAATKPAAASSGPTKKTKTPAKSSAAPAALPVAKGSASKKSASPAAETAKPGKPSKTAVKPSAAAAPSAEKTSPRLKKTAAPEPEPPAAKPSKKKPGSESKAEAENPPAEKKKNTRPKQSSLPGLD